MNQSTLAFRRDVILYAISAITVYVSAVHYTGTVEWWAGLVGVVATAIKAKLSPGKSEAVDAAASTDKGA